VFLVFVGLFAAFVPGDIVGDMTSIGTLFAFVLVCIGVMVMRKSDPNTPRPFRTPWVPFVPVLGAIVCLLMMLGLGKDNWLRLIVWMEIGFVIYLAYSVKNSRIRLATNPWVEKPYLSLPFLLGYLGAALTFQYELFDFPSLNSHSMVLWGMWIAIYFAIGFIVGLIINYIIKLTKRVSS